MGGSSRHFILTLLQGKQAFWLPAKSAWIPGRACRSAYLEVLVTGVAGSCDTSAGSIFTLTVEGLVSPFFDMFACFWCLWVDEASWAGIRYSLKILRRKHPSDFRNELKQEASGEPQNSIRSSYLPLILEARYTPQILDLLLYLVVLYSISEGCGESIVFKTVRHVAAMREGDWYHINAGNILEKC